MWYLLVFISFFIKSNFGQSPRNDDDERPLICDKTLRGSPAGKKNYLLIAKMYCYFSKLWANRLLH